MENNGKIMETASYIVSEYIMPACKKCMNNEYMIT